VAVVFIHSQTNAFMNAVTRLQVLIVSCGDLVYQLRNLQAIEITTEC